MPKTTDNSSASDDAKVVALANEEVLALQQQLAELTEKNVQITTNAAALTQANDDLSSANEEKAQTITELSAQCIDLKSQLQVAREELSEKVAILPPVDDSHPADDAPEELHQAIAQNPDIVAAAGLINGEQPVSVRRKLYEAAQRLGAFLEGGVFHNVK